MPDVKTYKVGKDVFDIPLKEEQDFLKTYPKATEVESYISGKDTFDIPKQEVQDFLKEYPQAKPLKKKDSSGVSSDVSQEDSQSGLVGQENTLKSQNTDGFRTVGSPHQKSQYNQEETAPSTLSEKPLIQADKKEDKIRQKIYEKPRSVEEFNKEFSVSSEENYNQNPQKILQPKDQEELLNQVDFKRFLKQKNDEQTAFKPEDSYLWSVVHGINKATYNTLKTMDGAARILSDVTKIPMSGTFGQMANKIDENLKNAKTKAPENIGGMLAEGAGSAIVDLPLMVLAPETKLSYIGAATGGLIKSIPGIVPYMAATNALNKYQELDSQENAEANKLTETFKAAGVGAVEGALMHSFGYLSSEAGGYVKGITNNNFASKLASSLSSGTLFGGMTATEQYMSGKVNPKEIVSSGILGLGMDLLLSRPAQQNLEAKQKSASDRFFTSSIEDLNKIHDLPKTVEQLREEQIKLDDRIKKEKDPKKKEELNLSSKTIDGYIDIKAIGKQILSDPEVFVRGIREDPKLSDPEKDFYIEKVNKFVAKNDPRIKASDPLVKEISDVDRQIQALKDNPSISEDSKPLLIEGLEDRKKNLATDAKKEMSKPLDIFELNKQEQLKSKEYEKGKGSIGKQGDLQPVETKNKGRETSSGTQKGPKIEDESTGQKLVNKKGGKSEKVKKGNYQGEYGSNEAKGENGSSASERIGAGSGKTEAKVKEGLKDATQKGKVSESRESEHKRIPQGGDVRSDQEKVREGKGGQASDSGKPGGEKTIPEEIEEVPGFVPEGMAEPEPAGTKTGKVEIGEKTETPTAMKKILSTGDKNVFSREIKKDGKELGEVHIEEKPEGWEVKYVMVNEKGKGYGKQIYRELNKQAQSEGKVVKSDRPDKISGSAKGLWDSLVKSKEAEKMPDGSYRMTGEQKAKPAKATEPKVGEQIGFKDMIKNNRIGEIMSKEADGRYKIKTEDGIIHKVSPDKIQSIESTKKAIKETEQSLESKASIPVYTEPKSEPVKASTIISKLSKDLDVPIRIGKIRKKALGIFKVHPEVIRTKEYNDLATTSHEVAHFLDKKLDISNSISNDLKKELKDLDYDQSKKRVNEGFAEFVRHYLTVGDSQDVAPKFHDYFEKQILSKNPVEKKVILEARDLITKWREQGSLNRVLSQVDFDGLKSDLSLKEKLESFDVKARGRFTNRLYPLKYVVNKIIGEGKIRPSEDPYEIAMSVAKTASAKARQFIMDGAFDFQLNKVGESLKDVVAPVSKDIKNAIAYAYSKHAITLLDRGINPGISRVDAEYVLKNNAKPEYEQFSQDFTQWSSHLVDYLVDAGGLSKDAADAMRASNPFYIPLKRSFVDQGISAATGKGYVDLGSPIKKIKGSGREIINPLESMAAMTEQIISVADKARVSRALVDIADKYPGSGKWIEKVPAPLKKTMIELEDISKQIESLGGDLSAVDKSSLINLFSQGDYYGKDNIVSIYKDGKREFYQLHKDLYDSMKGLDNVTLPWFIDSTFGSASRLVRLGATGIRAGFALITNPIRDFQTFVLQNEYTGTSRVGNVGKAIIEELVGKGKYTQAFKRAGGEMAQPLGLDRKMLKNTVEEVLADDAQRKALNIVKHPIEALRKILSFTEAGTRMAEFESVMKKYEPLFEKAQSDGDLVELKKLKEDAAIEASNAANEVTVNFKRAGSYASVINQIVPFFNPSVQGLSRMGRTIYEHPVRSGFRALAWMTAPTLALWYMHKDEDWYKNLPDWQKYGFFNFKIGDEIVRLPKPFEWGYLFGAIPEGIANSIYTKDPIYFKKASEESLGAIAPPALPALVKPAMEVYFNWDIFRDSPIISMSQEGLLPPQQYTSHSSKLAIELGQVLNVAPLNIDHLLSGYTGGLATDILNSFPKQYKEKADYPIIGRLFTRTSTTGLGGVAVQEFYDQYKRLSSVEKTLNFGEKNKIVPRNITDNDRKLFKYKYLISKTAKEITDLRSRLSELDKVKMDKDIRQRVVKEINFAAAKLAEKTLQTIKSENEVPSEYQSINVINKLSEEMTKINDVFKKNGTVEMNKYIKENNLKEHLNFYENNKTEFNKLKRVIDYVTANKAESKYAEIINQNADLFINSYNSNDRFRVTQDLNRLYSKFGKEGKVSKNQKGKALRGFR
jgi:hypothetical protein